MTTKKSATALRKVQTGTSKLAKYLEKVSKKKDYGNDQFWKITKGKDGNGQAKIRFLPEVNGDTLPWVELHTHAFKGPNGQWFIENCPTSIGQECPVCKANSVLWNTGNDDDKKTLRERKRKLSYISNIQVIEDPANPENNGKVFVFKYGKKIFDKIIAAMQPEFDDETPVNVFNAWDKTDPDGFGAVFKLKVRKVDGFDNYDKSEFGEPEELTLDKDEIEEIQSKCVKLADFVAADKFKSFVELEAKFVKVTGETVAGVSKTLDEEIAKTAKAAGAKSKKEDVPFETDDEETETTTSTSTDDDDIDDFLNSLTDSDDE